MLSRTQVVFILSNSGRISVISKGMLKSQEQVKGMLKGQEQVKGMLKSQEQVKGMLKIVQVKRHAQNRAGQRHA